MFGVKTTKREPVLGHTYELLFRIYTFSGFRKIQSKTKWKRYLHGFYFKIIWVWLQSLTVIFLIDAYLKRHNMRLLINNLYSTVMNLLGLIKYHTFLKRTDDIEKTRRNLAKSWCLPNIGYNKEDRKILLKAEREIFLLLLLFLVSGHSVALFWTLIPVLDFSSQERMLPMPFPEIFYVRETPGYECLYAFHAFTFESAVLFVVSYDLIYSSFFNQICAQYDILIKNLKQIQKIYPGPDYGSIIKGYKELSEEEDCFIETDVGEDTELTSKIQRKTETLKILHASIRHHQLIIREVAILNEMYSEPMFMEIGATAALIALITTDLLVEPVFSMRLIQELFYVGFLTGGVFIMSVFGTRILDKSAEVRAMIYSIPWYEMEKESSDIVRMMQIICLNPPLMKGGNIIPFHFGTFQTLLQVSYNVILVLLHVMN